MGLILSSCCSPARLLFCISITHGASDTFLFGISLLVSLEVRESLMLTKGSSALLTPTLSEHQNKGQTHWTSSSHRDGTVQSITILLKLAH